MKVWTISGPSKEGGAPTEQWDKPEGPETAKLERGKPGRRPKSSADDALEPQGRGAVVQWQKIYAGKL